MSKAHETLSLDDVDKIATLARLKLSADERTLYHRQLTDILDYVNQLQALDTTGIEPSFMVLPQEPRLRDDVVPPSLPSAAALHNAPEREGQYFKMPRILEEE